MKFIFLTLLLSLGWIPQAWSLDIFSIYSSNCKRNSGVILNVDSQTLDLLKLDGTVIKLPRYKVIYLATYPIDILPIEKLDTSFKIPSVTAFTRNKNEIVKILSGWPVNFSKNEISFLTEDGNELLVKKTDLWNIKKSTSDKEIDFKQVENLGSIYFEHPYPFSHCEKSSDTKNTRKISPQKLFADAVDIKREFDRLQNGHTEIDSFITKQKFYPAPEIYTNKSILGMWLMLDSRYGKSKSRTNNFNPFITNELSNGAYGYQHILSSGSGPSLYTTHSEIQTHIFYRMKAEYIHFSIFADPNLLLVGSQYDWREKDLETTDFRTHDSTHIELGLDYGKWSLDLYLLSSTLLASKGPDNSFHSTEASMPRFGLSYSGLVHSFNFFFGSTDQTDFNYALDQNETFELDIFRINHIFKFLNGNKLFSSYISKNGNFKGRHTNKYTSQTLSFQYEKKYKKRYSLSGILGLESFKVKSENTTNDELTPLLAIYAGLEF